MKPLVLLALLAACKTDDAHNMVIPGGGGGPGGTGGGKLDAPSTADGATFAGRVCLIADARDLTACATTGAAGLTVTLDGATATTADDGTFAIAAPQATNATWQVTGSTLVTSVMPSGLAQIPALTQTTYSDLQSNNGVILSSGEGSLFVRVVHAGAALIDATATAAPPAQFATFYDGTSAMVWGQNATGAHGVAWIPGVAVGTATVTVTPSGGTAQMISGVPIADGALTFLVVDVP